ncbi:hypothetical protein [Bacillus sp. V3-13]|uniref:hypothetical protein n=1 Tax=Bacillus sp. V3-13 TaxID=2053728 RepID=UPI00115C15DA|nr:hypothetical protein [Bacillus sp. V3-13]
MIQMFKGRNPGTGELPRVIDGILEGTLVPDFGELPEEFAPDIDRDDYQKVLKRLMSNIKSD